MRSPKLTKLIDTLDENLDGQKRVTFSDIVEILGPRGFGALLIVPASITILPTGAIPGVPIACAMVICLVAGQLVIGRERPWMPKSLGRVSISHKKFERALEHAKPVAEVVDELTEPRYQFLTKNTAQRVIALLCIALSLAMAVIGFIPFVPAFFSLPILLFAIGISLKDGLLALWGFVSSGAAVSVLPLLMSVI